jgi:hypothetical protein
MPHPRDPKRLLTDICLDCGRAVSKSALRCAPCARKFATQHGAAQARARPAHVSEWEEDALGLVRRTTGPR